MGWGFLGRLTLSSTPSSSFFSASSVLYFSIHRYEQGRFWPHLKASNWSTTGFGQGQGYTINVPWNQVNVRPPFAPNVRPTPAFQGRQQDIPIMPPCPQVGMRDADYIAAFLHLLLPVALEVLRGRGVLGQGMLRDGP